MVTCLDILKDMLAGQLAGVLAEFRDLPEQLINFMYEEAGEDLTTQSNSSLISLISSANLMTKKGRRTMRVM